MGDEMDGCECVWSHEMAMQRLIEFIRQRQQQCTDIDCIDVSGRMQQGASPNVNESDSNFTIMTMFLIFAVIMYIIRPESIMKLTKSKRSSYKDSQPPPPPPPPSAVN